MENSLTAESSRGMYRCDACEFCEWILKGPSFVLPNGRIHMIGHHVDCQTTGVIYIMFCRCGSFYVGKTIRNFWRWIYDHIYYIRKNLLYTPIGRHVTLKHNHDISMVKFTVLEKVLGDPRGENFDRKLLQREARWIFNHNATTAPGLNDAFSFKPFL